jgi:hypothetical protein
MNNFVLIKHPTFYLIFMSLNDDIHRDLNSD